MELFNPVPGTVTVYADLACPFATAALTGLRAARTRSGRDVHFDLRAFPLELINRRPHNLAALESEKSVLAAAVPGLGWRRWRVSSSEWPVTTLLPLEAVHAAKRPEVGGLAASDELDAALRRALYVDSRCVALLPVILEVAEECPTMDRAALAAALRGGAGRAEVYADLACQERGAVRGSPHVFTPDGRDWVNPGMTMEHAGDYTVVKSFEPAVYDEIVLAAGSA